MKGNCLVQGKRGIGFLSSIVAYSLSLLPKPKSSAYFASLPPTRKQENRYPRSPCIQTSDASGTVTFIRRKKVIVKVSIVIKVLKFITRIALYISYLAIGALGVMTVIDVVRRTVFGMTMNGVTEFSQMFLIVSMTAMAYTLADGRFIVVNVLVDRFPKLLNLIIEVFMGVVSLVFFVVVGIQLFNQIAGAIQFGESYFMIKVPKWPMYVALGASFFACVPATIVYVYERIINFKDPGEKTVLDENPDLAILSITEDDLADAGGKTNGS